ncbi:hypothetical protein [Micromonospora aurantiaca]|nr:hypothetical protein [Micromonospora aurantiaca]UFN96817.1 hypothetical protein LF814_12105 [Micromonospora aurantiaca]
MVDSNVHPRRGTGERTDNVRYSLQRQASGWLLQVDLDAQWLRDPSRVFPVIVDPSFTDNAETDDTYVSKRDHANRNNSAEGDLLVGTYNGGTERAASYLHFNDLKAS